MALVEDDNNTREVPVKQRKKTYKKVKIEQKKDDADEEEQDMSHKLIPELRDSNGPGEVSNKMPPFPCEKPHWINLTGPPGSGKTRAAQWLLYHAFKCGYAKFARVFSKTAKISGDFDILPIESVQDYSEGSLHSYVDALHEMKMELRNKGSKEKLPANILILDDLTGLLNWYHPKTQNFISCHRHYNCTVLNISQYLTANSTPLLRTCSTIYMSFRADYYKSILALYGCCGGKFKNKDDFFAVYMAATGEPYHCLLAFSGGRNTDLNNVYFSFKVDPVSENLKITF